jgi:RNA polymerase sigma factor (sigma-70 family)
MMPLFLPLPTWQKVPPCGRSPGPGVVGSVTVAPCMEAERSKASVAMARYAEGDGGAFAELYAELAPALTRYLRRVVRDQSAVDDLLQQVFLQMHLSRERFLLGSRVEPWAFTIGRAVAMEWLRRDYRRRAKEPVDGLVPPQPADDPLVGLSASELSDALRAELEGLSPKLREAFLLVRVDGLTHAEAAEVLGIEESATKVRAHRATNWLREKLSRFRPKEDPG